VKIRKSKNVIEIIEGSFSWEEGDFEWRNINLEIVKGSLNVWKKFSLFCNSGSNEEE
jgi:hypothetical protein